MALRQPKRLLKMSELGNRDVPSGARMIESARVILRKESRRAWFGAEARQAIMRNQDYHEVGCEIWIIDFIMCICIP
jgi:hypothetical protein